MSFLTAGIILFSAATVIMILVILIRKIRGTEFTESFTAILPQATGDYPVMIRPDYDGRHRRVLSLDDPETLTSFTKEQQAWLTAILADNECWVWDGELFIERIATEVLAV